MGNGPCAGRFEHLLAGNSVVFKQESSDIEFYYKGLQPGKHFISIAADMSNVVQKLRYAMQNDSVSRIASNANFFVRNYLSPDSVACYVAELFTQYARLVRFT